MNAQDRHDLQQLIREVVSEAVPPAVRQAMEHIGLNINDPTAVQEDMAYLRKLRRGSELIKGKAIQSCVGAAVLCFFTLLVFGIRAWLAQSGNLNGR